MMKKKGFTFIEILVASLLLITGIAMLTSVYLGFMGLIAKLHYRNTAYNLLRNVVEFAETEYVTAGCRFEYRYNPAAHHRRYESRCTSPTPCTICNPTVPRPADATCCSNPFSLLGDIKTRNYVPKTDPDSVVMIYEAQTENTMPDGFTLPIIWKGICVAGGGSHQGCSYDPAHPPPPCVGPVVCNHHNRVSGTICTGVITGSTHTCSCRMLCNEKRYYRIFASIQWTEEGHTYNEELRVVPLGYNKQPSITTQLGEFTEE